MFSSSLWLVQRVCEQKLCALIFSPLSCWPFSMTKCRYVEGAFTRQKKMPDIKPTVSHDIVSFVQFIGQVTLLSDMHITNAIRIQSCKKYDGTRGHYSHKQLKCVGMYIIGPGQLLGMRSEWFLNMEFSCVYDNTGTSVKLERFRHVVWHKFFRRLHKNMYQCICQELAPWQKYLACYSVTHRIVRQHVLCHTLLGLTAFLRIKLKHFSRDHWKCHQYHPKAWSYSLLVKSNYKLIRALLSC